MPDESHLSTPSYHFQLSKKALADGQALCSHAKEVSGLNANILVDALGVEAKIKWLNQGVIDQLSVWFALRSSRRIFLINNAVNQLAANIAKCLSAQRVRLLDQARVRVLYCTDQWHAHVVWRDTISSNGMHREPRGTKPLMPFLNLLVLNLSLLHCTKCRLVHLCLEVNIPYQIQRYFKPMTIRVRYLKTQKPNGRAFGTSSMKRASRTRLIGSRRKEATWTYVPNFIFGIHYHSEA